MTRRILNTIAMLLLIAVTAVSSARVLCLLPCVTGDGSAVAAHCGHETSGETARLSAQPDDCGDCDRITLDGADRLPSRHTVIAPSAAPTGQLVAQTSSVVSLRISAWATAPPRGPSPAQAPLPLRI